MANRIHWTHGASIADTLCLAFPGDDVVGTGDPLTNGPVRPLHIHATSADWLAVRGDWFEDEFGTNSDSEYGSRMEDFCEQFAHIDAFDEVVIWVADDIGPQLFFCWAVAVLLAAIDGVLDRFPDSQTGLSLWEALLLGEIGESQGSAARIMGEVLAKTWEHGREPIGDGVLFNRLVELSDPSHDDRLVERQGDSLSMTSDFALTDVGHPVLAGQANRIDLMGIDRWIGGASVVGRRSRLVARGWQIGSRHGPWLGWLSRQHPAS